MLTRRRLLHKASAVGALGAAYALAPAWARGAMDHPKTAFDLTIAETPFTTNGRTGVATTVNGGVPGPLLRWREGDEVTLRVSNALDVDTSIHWHGVLLPNGMDGVPGVTFDGIKPGETFTYRFPVRQSGTYWYHAHSRFQEQTGVYGPIIIDPAHGAHVEHGSHGTQADREYVVVLSDWTFESPERVFANLKRQPDYYNYQRRTVGDFLRDAREQGLGAAVRERRMWGAMRMSATDIADVTGATYTYLMNGLGPQSNWTALFRPGERVRLRIINASAMTYFDVRIPGLPMTVVAADGVDVEPVETDEFRIAVAETYDVIVAPRADEAHTIFAESMDRSGYARGTLATREGAAGALPARRPRPVRSMTGMDHDMAAAPMSDMTVRGGRDTHATVKPSGHDMSSHDMAAMPAPAGDPVRSGPGVAMRAMAPAGRLDDPGIGLGADGWRVLSYAQLRNAGHAPDHRPPERELELHLTANMERYMWSFDGMRSADANVPIHLAYGERLRLVLVNDTMMEHPIHLHGMFMELDTGAGHKRPLKHTVNVKPGERTPLLLTADESGDWAFHCHLLYHMVAGMFRVVRVAQPEDGA